MRSIGFFLLAFTACASGQSVTPETPTGTVLRSWLEAFNSGDSAKLLAFWQKYGADAPEPHVAGDRRLRDLTGGLKLFKVIRDDGSEIVAVMEEGRGGYSESTITLASGSPPVIKRISGHPVPPPAGRENHATSDQELAERVRAHVASMKGEEQFSGAVLIAHNGRLVLDQAWGLADREKQIKNTVDTQFCLGSINKMFTAVAVLQLVQQGKLSLDGTISDYWLGYPNHDLASRVKIRQLLSHTGGTGDIFTPEYEAHRLETRTIADYVKLYGDRPLLYEPGSHMEYSNYGFILLGRLIEIVTGEPYEGYVRKHVYAPAGMTHTDSRPETEHVPGRAIGYTKGARGLEANTSTLPWSGTSAGGGYSTVGDLRLFADALQSGKLLDPALLQQATTDQTHTGYGFGFYVLKDGVYGHGGGSPGMNGEMHVIPKKGYVIVVLANRDPFTATNMENYIETSLPVESLDPPAIRRQLP
jgi:CubicO group peptidase (beta-lactamase class C family)